MRKDHSPKWMRFDEMCQKAGEIPKVRCRMFIPAALVTERSIKQVSPNPDRSIIFAISTPGVKRDGHEIMQEGWHTANYRQNPVVMWAHSRDGLPIANSLWEDLANIRDVGKSLHSEADFLDATDNPFADQVLRLYKKGILNATSVGWRTLKYELNRDNEGYVSGIRFLEQDLTEYSGVPVPADPNALQAELNSGAIRSEFKANFAPAAPTDHDDEGDVFQIGYDEPVEEKKRKIFIEVGNLPSKQSEAESETLERGVIPYARYALAAREDGWDASKARKQFKDYAGGEGENFEADKYAAGFLYTDDPEHLSSYKGPHHYVENGKIVTVYRGVTAAAQRLQQKAFDVPIGSLPAMRKHIGDHYADFKETAPWDRAIGRMYEQVHADLQDKNLTDNERDTLRSTAENLSKQIYGESRINEPWEDPYEYAEPWRAAAGAVNTMLSDIIPDSEDREQVVRSIVIFVQPTLKSLEDAATILRTIFEKTETKNSDELMELIDNLRESESDDADIAGELSNAMETLTSILSQDSKIDKREKENTGDENNSAKVLNTKAKLDNLFRTLISRDTSVADIEEEGE